jgi:hypothetical protein
MEINTLPAGETIKIRVTQSRSLQPFVRLKRSSQWICRKTAQHQHRVYCGEVVLPKGTPARELEPIAAYRLVIDVGCGWRSSRKVTGQDNPQCLSDPLEIMV